MAKFLKAFGFQKGEEREVRETLAHLTTRRATVLMEIEGTQIHFRSVFTVKRGVVVVAKPAGLGPHPKKDAVYFVGAVGLGSLVFSVLYWGVSFLRMGIVGLTSQSQGAGDLGEAGAILGRGISLALLLGFVMIVAQQAVAWAAFGAIDATPETELHARAYFHIRVLAAPAALLGMVFTGWFYGMQRVMLPVVIQIGVNAINILLDLWFVRSLGLAVEGVAWATVIAQYAGLGANLAGFALVFPGFWGRVATRAVFSRDRLLAMLAINGDLFIRTACLLGAQYYFMARSAAHGDLILAANSILFHFRNFTAYGLDGFSSGAEVLVGSAIGGARRQQLRLAIRLSLVWGGLLGVVVAAVYWFARAPLLAAFTDQSPVLELAQAAMIWIVLDAILGCYAHILDGIFFGATASRTMRNAMLVTVGVFYFPTFLVLEPIFGNSGMWAAIVVLMVVRGITLAIPLAIALRRPEWRLK